MTEMAGAGNDHGDTMFVGGGDNFFVAHRAAGLDDGFGAGFGEYVDAVTEGEEGVRSDDRSLQIEAGMLCLDAGDLGRVDARHLAGANTERHAAATENDGVGLDELGDAFGEQ